MIGRCIGVLIFLLGAVTSGLSFGQAPPYTVEIIPNNPTSLSPVTVRIGVDQCNVSFRSITYPSPNTIRIDLDLAVCPGTPFGPFTLSLGVLPPGTYSVEVFQSLAPRGSATFSVVAALASGAEAIPALSDGILALLALAIAAIGAYFGNRGDRRITRNILLTAAATLVASFGFPKEATAQSGERQLLAGSFVPARVKIRFNPALLDPSREEIRDVMTRPSTSTLAASLGYPKSMRRLIGREPTAFEEYLVRKFPDTPDARLTQYFVLDYSTGELATAARPIAP